MSPAADPIWRAAPADPAASPRAVDVWRVFLRVGRGVRERLNATLGDGERERAARFVFPEGRDHFIVARGALREILGRYLRSDPRAIAFEASSYGKPFLAPGVTDPTLRFNLSHSGDRALCAVTRGREVGVDVERIREDIEVLDIARRFFSAGEVEALRRLPPERLREGFFTCWTRKEAYIKARGEGLSMPLDRFDVSVAPGSEARLLEARGEAAGAEPWVLRALDPGEGYVAAVAVEGARFFEVRCFDWETTA